MSDTNIKIIAGTAIPSPDGVDTNYQFEYLDFREIESVALNSVPSNEDLKTMMSGKTQLIRMHTIGETGGLDVKDIDNTMKMLIVNSADATILADKPCGIISQSGSIIPQIIVPSDSCKYVDNGIVFNSDTRENQLSGEGYTWVPGNIGSSPTDEKKRFVYGERGVGKVSSEYSYTGYVSMDGCSSFQDDYPQIETRTFTCDTSLSTALQGSCAICYYFYAYNGTGGTSSPQLVISLSNITSTKAIVISVPPAGDIIGRVGDDVASGSLSATQEAIMPPHIVKSGNSLNMTPLYIYPLYSGFVISSSATQSLKSNNNSVFIPYSKINDPNYEIKVNGATKSEEINQIITSSGSELQFFPTLIQEASNESEVSLEINSANRIKFGTTITLQWIKSYGRFAYCPIYFHRKLHFTLYFKGEYVVKGETAGDYRFYPAVCADIVSGVTSEDWTGINGYGGISVSASLVCSDSELQESIYKAEFVFESSVPQRYPIEVFGCAQIYKRNGFDFSIKNDNGTFKFANTINPQFSWLNENRYSESLKNYIDLITNVTVQSSLSNVNGTLTLDSYPLTSRLDNIKLTQSIGELNLKIDNETHNLFTGYGMELNANVSESSHTIGIRLEGIQKKLEDMKLICVPFWDGDRLQSICAYFEAYTNIKLKMVNYQTTNISSALSVGSTIKGSTGSWKSNSSTIVNTSEIAHPDFRVPRSFSWRKPAVDFQSGTSCFEALNKLAELTSCAFVVQPDGIGYFFELNNFGIPYYVDNQTEAVATFDAKDIISINLSPYLENKYNNFATFAFLQKKNKKGERSAQDNSVQMGSAHTERDDTGSLVNFPWSRIHVSVENGFVTKNELNELHSNTVKYGISDIYQGSVAVAGNMNVTHIYQRVKICGIDFFVISIDHNIDLQSKEWTTSYGLNLFETED